MFYLGHEVCWEWLLIPLKSTKLQYPNQSKIYKGSSYYHWFVCNFTSIAKPLYQLTEKTATFEWTVECQEAFTELRHKLCTAPVLAFPDFTKAFILDTDTSKVVYRHSLTIRVKSMSLLLSTAL